MTRYSSSASTTAITQISSPTTLSRRRRHPSAPSPRAPSPALPHPSALRPRSISLSECHSRRSCLGGATGFDTRNFKSSNLRLQSDCGDKETTFWWLFLKFFNNLAQIVCYLFSIWICIVWKPNYWQQNLSMVTIWCLWEIRLKIQTHSLQVNSISGIESFRTTTFCSLHDNPRMPHG